MSTVTVKPSSMLTIPADIKMEQLYKCYEQMKKIKKNYQRRQKTYRSTDKGKEAYRLANRKYYYKKNDIYHQELNPNGSVRRPKSSKENPQ